MESRINETLCEKLFRNPTPLDRKKQIFWYLYERMFPCREIMKDFLLNVDASERTECAKYIVQRLCFEANFPPPYFLLVSLLDFEKNDENQSSHSAYIPQDHFSHIVYMYLLGIYLFFYSPSLNKALTKEFMRKRTEAGYNPVLDATKDFISFWKYFCLFHDIAYPIENAYEMNKDNRVVLKKKQECEGKESVYDKYLTNFNEIECILSREILLEGATKYLIVWQMLDDCDNNHLFENVIVSSTGCFLQKEDRAEKVGLDNIKAQFGGYQSIDKLHCFEHVKMFTGFVDADDYIIVLFDAFSEQPIAFKYTPSASLPQYYILKNKYNFSTDISIHKLLDHEDYMLHEDFYIRYYFKDLEAIMEKLRLKTGSGEDFSKKDIRTILNRIGKLSLEKDRKPERMQHFERITTSHDLNTYIFQCYRTLSLYTGQICSPKDKLPSKSATSLLVERNKKVVQEYLHNNFKNNFKHAVIEEMPFVDYEKAEKRMGRLGDEKQLMPETINRIVDEAVDYLFNISYLEKYVREIKTKFAKELIAAIEEEKNVNGLMNLFICQCNKELFRKLPICSQLFLRENGVDIEKIMEVFQENPSVDKYLQGIEQYLNEKFENRNDERINLVDFIREYKTKYYVYDHGIYGAGMFLLCFQYYGKVITKLFGRENGCDTFRDMMSTLCWNVERTKYDNKLQQDYEHVAMAVQKSIFCHNLYPDVIRQIYQKPGIEWKYDLLKEPSMYFGMMVDALQVWNREKYYRHAKVDWYPMFSSDYYDIAIEQNRIVLKIKSYHNNISQVIDKFLAEKDTYLKDFSLLVRVEVKDV